MHKFMTGVTGFPGSNYFYDIRDVIYAGAIVYDWCYDALTPQQRKEMVEAFYRLAVRLEVSWPPLRQAITIGHGNGGQITIAPLAFAIACFDEDPEPFRIITYRVLEELVPMKAYEYRSPLHPRTPSILKKGISGASPVRRRGWKNACFSALPHKKIRLSKAFTGGWMQKCTSPCSTFC